MAEEIPYNDADMLTVRRRLASDGAAMEYFFTTYDCFNRPIKEEYRYGENNARESIYFMLMLDALGRRPPAYNANRVMAKADAFSISGLSLV